KRLMLKTQEEAYHLLRSLGAPNRLIVHAKLVGEAAEVLLSKMRSLGVKVREDIVRLGVAVHDAGKITHQRELDEKGREHEASGEELLLKAGVQPVIARCCVSHARYNSLETSLEELLIALSDKLWKGERAGTLELRVVDAAAKLLGKSRWHVFTELDD